MQHAMRLMLVVIFVLGAGCASRPADTLAGDDWLDGGPKPTSDGAPSPADSRATADTRVAGDLSATTRVAPIPGCERLTKESAYCIALFPGRMMMFGLDTGEVCQGHAVKNDPKSSSLAWIGGTVYACDGQRMHAIQVATGAMTSAKRKCEAVTEQGGGLLVMESIASDELTWFPSYASFRLGTKGKVYKIKSWASRLAANKDTAYLAWHSTDSVQVAKVASGAKVSEVKLVGYDDWIMGLDVTDDGRLVIVRNTYVHIFDVKTGAKKKVHNLHPYSLALLGLSCASRVK